MTSGSNTPVRCFVTFLLLLLGAMLFAALATPWAAQLVSRDGDIPLDRIFNRLMLLGLIAGTTWLLLSRHQQRSALLGYTGPAGQFARHFSWGLVLGLLLMLVTLLPLVILGAREWNGRFPMDFAGWARLVAKGLGSGIAVALLEETFFRGAMQGALQRVGGWRWGLFAVPLLYAAVHFLGQGPDANPALDAWSGFTTWKGSFTAFGDPSGMLDAFAALYFVGLLLALVRQFSGSIAGCIGLHAGFVTLIAVFRKITSPAADSKWSFLVGSFDGLLGSWIAGLAALICILIWRQQRHALP